MAGSVVEKIKLVEQSFVKKVPSFNVGDTVHMMVKVAEADKVRLHPFEGTIIAKNGTGIKASFTVRKISFGEGVERVFPLYSPMIESIKVVNKGIVKRSKLYYLRGKAGKESRVKVEQQSSS
ncbi:MAG: 50S ribosomal protein L19 [Candidatus Omnitrophota bacterium]